MYLNQIYFFPERAENRKFEERLSWMKLRETSEETYPYNGRRRQAVLSKKRK